MDINIFELASHCLSYLHKKKMVCFGNQTSVLKFKISPRALIKNCFKLMAVATLVTITVTA